MSSTPRLKPQELDELALAAYAAIVFDNVERAQVNRLIEILESLRDVNYLLAYMARQVGRGVWSRSHRYFSASKLYSILKGKDINTAREILGIFKWLYEAGSNRSRQLAMLRSKVRNVTAKAPQNFFHDYLDAVLR